MKIVLCYPPRAYPYMPYSAMYYLKGFIEHTTNHIVSTDDLNIEYFRKRLWSPELLITAKRSLVLHQPHEKQLLLIAELLSERGDWVIENLRTPGTYQYPDQIRYFYLLLNEAVKIEDYINQKNGIKSHLPVSQGTWQKLVEMWRPTLLAQFIQQEIFSGRYDHADVLGISVAYNRQLIPALLIARYVKTRCPHIKIVIGGNALTTYLDDFIKDYSFWLHIDAGIPYDGEILFLKLLDNYVTGKSLLESNIIISENGHIYYNKSLKQLEVAPAVPNFSDLIHLFPTPEPVYPILTTRGCYWGKCAFCTHHQGYGTGFSKIAEINLQKTLMNLMEKGVKRFYFVDEALPLSSVVKIANLLNELHATQKVSFFNKPFWMAETRAEKIMLKEKSLDTLTRSGCKLLIHGIESGSQRVSDLMQKGIDLKQTAQIAKECSRIGIKVGWMFFIGFPGETEEEAMQTIEYIISNKRFVDYISIGTFYLERHSPLWYRLKDFGIRGVINSDKPYPITFDYLVDNNQMISSNVLKLRLKKLRHLYPELRELFRDTLDRAFVLFLSNQREIDNSLNNELLRWKSQLTSAHACLNFKNYQIELTKYA